MTFKGHSRSSEVTQFNKLLMISYYCDSDQYLVLFSRYGENCNFLVPHPYLMPLPLVTLSEFCSMLFITH